QTCRPSALADDVATESSMNHTFVWSYTARTSDPYLLCCSDYAQIPRGISSADWRQLGVRLDGLSLAPLCTTPYNGRRRILLLWPTRIRRRRRCCVAS